MGVIPLNDSKIPNHSSLFCEGNDRWKQRETIELIPFHGEGECLQKTWVSTCWDESFIHIQFFCEDQEILATLTDRNAKVWQEEAVEVFICPSEDMKVYYEFQVSPLNVVRDVKVLNPNGLQEGCTFQGEWECLELQTNAYKTNIGWNAEISIPFTGLGCSTPRQGDTWRINFYRIDRVPREEYSVWSVTRKDKAEFHRPFRFGYIQFHKE
jgi:hypothetical protein